MKDNRANRYIQKETALSPKKTSNEPKIGSTPGSLSIIQFVPGEVVMSVESDPIIADGPPDELTVEKPSLSVNKGFQKATPNPAQKNRATSERIEPLRLLVNNLEIKHEEYMKEANEYMLTQFKRTQVEAKIQGKNFLPAAEWTQMPQTLQAERYAFEVGNVISRSQFMVGSLIQYQIRCMKLEGR